MDRLLWHPWLGHWYPGVTAQTIGGYSIGQLVEMADFAERNSK